MTLDNINNILLIAIFLLPGFYIRNILILINPTKLISYQLTYLSCIMYSIINFAFWSWAYALIIHFNLFPTPIKISLEQSWYCWLILVVLTLITATITAYCIGFIYQKRIFLWPAKNLFKLKTIDPTETAWDWLFLQAKPFLLQITLKDGVEIYGLYGENSFISSKEDDRDIFLEYQYKVGKGGQYEQVDDNEGIYIPRDSIKFFAIKIQKE